MSFWDSGKGIYLKRRQERSDKVVREVGCGAVQIGEARLTSSGTQHHAKYREMAFKYNHNIAAGFHLFINYKLERKWPG